MLSVNINDHKYSNTCTSWEDYNNTCIKNWVATGQCTQEDAEKFFKETTDKFLSGDLGMPKFVMQSAYYTDDGNKRMLEVIFCDYGVAVHGITLSPAGDCIALGHFNVTNESAQLLTQLIQIGFNQFYKEYFNAPSLPPQ